MFDSKNDVEFNAGLVLDNINGIEALKAVCFLIEEVGKLEGVVFLVEGNVNGKVALNVVDNFVEVESLEVVAIVFETL